jgi:hypothetical protein
MSTRVNGDPFAWDPPDLASCFLCGVTLPEGLTKEHVFPRWLQERYALGQQTISLLNGTTIKYSQLVVGACATCNNDVLSQLETYVRRHVEAGYDGFVTIDRDRLALWVCKLYFGLLWRELSLAYDRTDPASGPIVEPELLERFRIVRGLLRGLIQPRTYVGDMRPWSVFIVRTQAIGDVLHDYDYGDGFARVVAMRMGDIGIIASLEDNGLHARSFGLDFEVLHGHTFHPAQFLEMYARVAYNQIRLNRRTSYLTIQPRSGGGPTFIAPLPPEVGFSTAPALDEADSKMWAHMLSIVWARYGIAEEDIPYGPGQFFTVITDANDAFIEIPPGYRLELPKRAPVP